METMATTQSALIDTHAAALAANVPPAQIRSWLHRGKLTHHGYDHAHRALIDLNELQNLKPA